MFFGSGAQVLIPSRIAVGAEVYAYPEMARDLENAGYKVHDSRTSARHWSQIAPDVWYFDSVKAWVDTCNK